MSASSCTEKYARRFRLIDAVEVLQAVDLRRRDFGYLRLIGVERGNCFRHRSIAADFAERRDHSLRSRQRWAAADILFRNSNGSRKIAPQPRMRSLGILFFSEIFHHRVAQRTFGSRGQHPQMLGKCFDVAVILRGVQLEGLTAKLARLPILVERVIQ